MPNDYVLKHLIEFSDGRVDSHEGFPIAVVKQSTGENEITSGVTVYFPVVEEKARANLYGRMMTLLEAMTENPEKLEAMKSVFGKEISQWYEDLCRSAEELHKGGDSSSNVYSNLR